MASQTDGNSSYPSTTEDGASPWELDPQPISSQNGISALSDTRQPARSVGDIRERKISRFNSSVDPKTDIGAFATISKAMDFANIVISLFSVNEFNPRESSWNPYSPSLGERAKASTFCHTTLSEAQQDRLGTVTKDKKSLRNVYEDCLWAEVHNHSDIFNAYRDSMRNPTVTEDEQGESEPQQKINFNDVVTAFEETFGDPESIIANHETDDKDLSDLFTNAKVHIKSFRDVISEGRERWQQSFIEREAYELSNANADHTAKEPEVKEHVDTVDKMPSSRDESRNPSNRSNSEQCTSVGLSLKRVVSSMAIAGGLWYASNALWNNRKSIASALGWSKRS